VIDLITDGQNLNDLIINGEATDLFKSNCCVMLVRHNSSPASSVTRVDEIVMKRKKMFEALYDRLSLPLSLFPLLPPPLRLALRPARRQLLTLLSFPPPVQLLNPFIHHNCSLASSVTCLDDIMVKKE
jgi:hypothetical protein